MDSIEKSAVTVMAMAVAAITLAYFLPRACGTYNVSDARQSQDSAPHPLADLGTHEAQASPAASFPAEAGVSLSRPGSSTEHGTTPATVGDGGSSPRLATILDDLDISEPCAGHIAWLTIELWNQPEFLNLTQQEAHDLLPLDDTVGLHGPDSLLSVFGDLPTLEDCEKGFASQAVQDALRETLALEALIIELGGVPVFRRDHLAQQRVDEACRMRDSAQIELMKHLEEATGYPHWRMWQRLYWSWSR